MNVDALVKEILDDLKANRLKLPTLPQVALKINDVISKPDANAKNVAKVVNADTALSVRIIQVANSPLVRGASAVDNVQSAVTRMGMGMVRNIVTSFLVRQLFHSKHDNLKIRVGKLWNHSVHVAAISHVLATQHTSLKADEAMLAGVIHDIGKLPIIAKADDNPSLANNEEVLDKLLDKLHIPLGKVIVHTWGFAPAIVDAVAEHENFARDSGKVEIADVVTVANLLSYAGKNHRLAKMDWTRIPAFKKLDLTPEDSIAALEDAREEISEIAELLGAS